jgi:Patatin-like phospholipase
MGILERIRRWCHPAAGGDGGLRRWVAARPRWKASRLRRSDRWRYYLTGVRPEPIPAFLGPVEKPHPGRSGICCSGGGIRSAAFNLGALQELQADGALAKASYLAAVSGGSYIAAAFAMVGKRWQSEARPSYEPDNPLNGYDDSNPELIAKQPPFARGSPEEQYLRNRSAYLAPDGMRKLFLGYRILLALVVNVSFLAFPLFGATVIAGDWIYRPHFHKLLGDCNANPELEPAGCVAHIPLLWWAVPVGIVALSVLFGVVGLLWRLGTDSRQRFLDVWASRLLIVGAAFAFLSVGLPALIDLLRGGPESLRSPQPGNAGIAAGISITALLAGVGLYLREATATPKAVGEELGRISRAVRKVSSKARLTIAYAAAFVVGPALFAGVVVFTLSYTLAHSSPGSIDATLTLVAGAALLLFGVMCWRGNLTTWSLHPFYKRQLCTVFALKRVRPSDLIEDPHAEPRTEVKREEQRGIAVERDFDTLVPLSQTGLPADSWPTLLVCAAANVSDPGATPPGRSVTSFTFSAETIGGPLVGAMRTADYEGVFDRSGTQRSSDFTLPAAVAMSGAALSPSMGKMTRRPLTFLMALANIRLGVWIPNPRRVAGANGTPAKRFKRPRPHNLFFELIGRNRIDAKYLYVTDGGHYENLGLVELMRRGCTAIYCFDASGGESFGELGDAIALARSELGVEIRIDPSPLAPDGKNNDLAASCAVEGSFTYADGTEGALVYTRNVMTAKAPWDVRAYHLRDPAFPHNTTVDQFYTDQKFEGYRALGEHAARRALALLPAR